jgi:DNA-binding CsgD family transcriptional regulator
LIGRDGIVAELASAARSGEMPLIVVAGETGIGRTAVLDEIHRTLIANGARVLAMRVDEHDRQTPYGALYRLLADLGGPASDSDVLTSVLGLVAKLSLNAATRTTTEGAVQLTAAICTTVRQHAPLVAVLDDAQHLDESTAALLDPLVRRLAGMGCALVIGVRCGDVSGENDFDNAARETGLRRLVQDGLARRILLRALTKTESVALIARDVSATPAADLTRRLHEISRGNPAALTAAIDGYRSAEVLRVVDRHAYLRPAIEPPLLPESHPLIAAVRRTGADTWSVARAMAILAPLGASAPALVAEALEIGEAEVRAALAELTRRRVLVRANGWRFRLPVVRAVLESCLGPFERRQLSALAAQAVWDGKAEADDENYLPDRLADAGALVDAARSAEVLLARAADVVFTDGLHAVRWLRAVIDRVATPAERAMMQMAHSSACAIHIRMREAVESARPVLEHELHHLAPEMQQELQIVYVVALAGCGETAELTRIVDRENELFPEASAPETVARGYALALLGRSPESYDLIRSERQSWTDANPVTTDFGNMLMLGTGVMVGDSGHLHRFMAEPERWQARDFPQHRFEGVRLETDMLLVLGEQRAARDLLVKHELTVEQLTGPGQFLVHFAHGDWPEAMEIARRSIADGVFSANPLPQMMMYREAAEILSSTGWLSRARSMAESARSDHLRHLLDLVESGILRELGEDAEADEMLARGLKWAEQTGQVPGTEELLAELAWQAAGRGRTAEAEQYLVRLRAVADGLCSGRAEIAYLQTKARVRGDVGAAREAVRLARERAQPYEMAKLFTRIALYGVDTQELLPAAYELFGELDALLWRAKLRQYMRAAQVPVPGRSKTTAENERLLAVLVTEGLTNRQLALVLDTSEKSVEGRLTRMFARIGYRSRVELAAAMLTGEYPG